MEIFSQETLQFIEAHPVLLSVLFAWSLFWTGMALWKSARLSHKWWFLIVLVVNSVGIVAIIYLYFIARRYSVETKETK